MKKILRILGYIFLAMLGFALAVQLCLIFLLPPVINKVLSSQLNTDVDLEGLQLRLLRGRVGIRKLTIEQPEGFREPGTPPFFAMEQMQIAASSDTTKEKHLEISDFQIQNLAIHIIRDAEGILNMQKLAPETAAQPEPPEEREASTPRDSMPTFTLKQFQLPNAVIGYTDLSVTPPIHVAITNLQVELSEFQFDTTAAASSTNLPGKLRITGTILQPEFPNGFLGLEAALGIASTNIPAVNTAIRIVGFDIRSLSGILPPGIATAIGGHNLDVVVDASVAQNHLDVQNRLQTVGNTLRLKIGGTPDKPDIDKSTALFNLVTRPGAFLTGTVSDVADAGVAAGRTVVSSAGKAGSGILSGVANIGRGAARAAQSAAKGDIKGIGDGVVDMTFGTVTGAVETVTSTAKEVGGGIGDTMSAAAGRSQTQGWEKANEQRWEIAWQEALHFVSQAPFPGN